MKKVKWAILIISIISSFFLINNPSLDLYDRILLALIPISYGICFFMILPKKMVMGAGLCMMLIVTFLRYIVYPILFSHDRVNINLMKYYDSSIALTLFEMVFIFILLNRYYDFRKWKTPYTKLEMDKINPIVPIILLIYTIGVYYFSPMVFADKHFILNAEEINVENDIVEHGIPGFLTMPVSWGNVLIVSFIFSIFYNWYIKYHRKLYFYLSVMTIMCPCLFYTGHSRLSLLMPLIGSMFMLVKVYRNRAKTVIRLIGVYGILAILVLSWYKFNTDSVSTVEFEMYSNADSINAYFGGLKNMMIGLRAYESFGHSLEVFVNDIFRNTMGISSFFVDNINNSVYIFNNSAYYDSSFMSADQICPTIIEGALCFGMLFCFIPTLIMVKAISWLDKQWYKTSSIEFAYLFASIATLEGWCLPGNLMHLSTSIFNVVIPVSVLIIMNRKLSIKKQKV